MTSSDERISKFGAMVCFLKKSLCVWHVHMRECVFISMNAGVCTQCWKTTWGVSLHHPPWDKVSHCLLMCTARELACELWGFFRLGLSSHSRSVITDTNCHIWLQVGSVDLNSGPCSHGKHFTHFLTDFLMICSWYSQEGRDGVWVQDSEYPLFKFRLC